MLKPLISALLAMGCASTAYALDEGYCATPDTLTASLKAESQRSIASAQRVTAEKQFRGMIFTMSADRSVGYILQADRPLGERAGQICVHTRLANIRLFDARKPGTPAEVLLRASDADSMRGCDVMARGGNVGRASCSGLNMMVRKAEAWGERVMMQGFGVDKQGDGSYRPNGTLATVSGRIGGSLSDFKDSTLGIAGDIMFSSLPDGASFIHTGLAYPEYTPYGLEVLAP